MRLYLRRPRRSWWVLDSDGTLVWDFWTHRGARLTADALNAGAIRHRARLRYRVERMP